MDPTWLRVKTVTQAGLARIPFGGAKESVSPSLSKQISRSRLPYHLTSVWRRIWSKMFRNDNWHRHMEKAGLIPTLVGADIHLLSRDDKATPKVLVLAVPREDREAVALMQSLFIKSLRAHSYDPSIDQLTFTDWNLVVNISSLNTYDKIVLEDPTRLFRPGERLTTTALFYEAEAQPQDIRPGLFGGLCKGLPRSIADIRNVCSVMLRYGNGIPMYQRFERPGCPPVREIVARYQEAEIGPWRFERSVLKLENYKVWAGNCQR